jgi:hypothetical protein
MNNHIYTEQSVTKPISFGNNPWRHFLPGHPKFVDGVCGAFKTTYAIEEIGPFIKAGLRYIIASPTKRLSEQSFTLFKKTHPQVTAIRLDSDSFPGQVHAELRNILYRVEPSQTSNDAMLDVSLAMMDGEGVAVFITWHCLFGFPWFNNSDWHLLIDEIPPVEAEFSYKLTEAETIPFVRDLFVTEDCGQLNYHRLVIAAGMRAKVERWAKNRRNDTVIDLFAPLLRQAISPHADLYIGKKAWAALAERENYEVTIHTVLRPSVLRGWASVRIMGAMWPESAMALLWGRDGHFGVDFQPDELIVADATTHDRRLGDRIRIHSIGERAWSKTTRAKISSDPTTAIAAFAPAIKELFGDEPFLWAANNDVGAAFPRREFPQAIRIPNVSHGLNDYREVTKIAFLSALNNKPAHFSFMNEVFGMRSCDMHRARAYQAAYQALMRTNARQCDSAKPVDVVVADMNLAHWCMDVFPDAHWYSTQESELVANAMGKSKVGRGNPRRGHATAAERKRKQRAREKELEVTLNTYIEVLKVTGYDLTHVPQVDAKEVMSSHHTLGGLRDLMRRLADTNKITRKEDNAHMTGASFICTRFLEWAQERGIEVEIEGSTRGSADISHVALLMLDCDGGEFKPADMRKVFPDMKWLAFNSARNGIKDESGNPLCKFHAAFPFRRPCDGPTFVMAWDAIVLRLRHFGWFVGTKEEYDLLEPETRLKFSGIERKRGAHLFYAYPCVPITGVKHKIWLENWDDVEPVDAYWLAKQSPMYDETPEQPAYRNPASYQLVKLRQDMAEIAAERLDSDDAWYDYLSDPEEYGRMDD